MAREQVVEALARLPASPRTAAVVERAMANERLVPFALKVIARHAIPGFEDRSRSSSATSASGSPSAPPRPGARCADPALLACGCHLYRPAGNVR
jgi:hypothetical protein